MIRVSKVSKQFGAVSAVREISLSVEEGHVFGLVGTNGAGKTTLLRMMAGVLRADGGSIEIDGDPVWDNPVAKSRLCFISDDPYFFPGADAATMERYYAEVYRDFDRQEFERLLGVFGLSRDRRISEYSKGMRRILAILLGLGTHTRYLLLDEVFDGLDPVMRQSMKSVFADQMQGRGLTPVISSHSMRELEDICDDIGVLHAGGLLRADSLEGMKLSAVKVQCVFSQEEDLQRVRKELTVVSDSVRGRLHTMVIRERRQAVERVFSQLPMTFFEVLPLNLEEIFIEETEAVGYETRKIITG